MSAELPTSEQIEVWPVMGRLAIALKEGRAYRLWSYLNQLSRLAYWRGEPTEYVYLTVDDWKVIGSGKKSLKAFQYQLMEARQLGYIREIVPVDDHCWRVYIASMKRVQANLRIRAAAAGVALPHEPERGRVIVSVECLSSWLGFCGEMFSAWAAWGEGNSRTVPGYSEIEGRITTEDLWRVTRQQILKWRKHSQSLTARRNWGTQEGHRKGDQATARKYSDGYSQAGFNSKRPFKGRDYRYWVRPLSHQSSLTRSSKGQARYLPKYDQPDLTDGMHPLSSSQQHPIGHSDNTWDTDAPKPCKRRHAERINFESEKVFSQERRARPTEPLYLMVSRKERTWARMWEYSPRL